MRNFGAYLKEATAPINIGAVRSMFEKSLLKLTNKESTPGEIAKAIRSAGSKKYLYGVTIRKTPELDPGDISVFGFYDGNLDQQYVEDSGTELPIELLLIFSSKDKKLALTGPSVVGFSRYLSETLAHEWIHLKQERARGWKEVGPKRKYMHRVENIELGSYLARDDEIEAHALNIAGSILDHVRQEKKLALQFLKTPKTGVLSDHHFDMYLKTFGGASHPVIKRLFKKIVFYINKRG
jgi:hypothetical protein